MRVGVVGGGQLGRMLGLAGIPLGMRFRFLEPTHPCPAGECGEVITRAYDDALGLERFVDGLSLATYEFENVPAQAAAWISERVPLHPSTRSLTVSQDRIVEKRAFEALGIPVHPFAAVSTPEDARDAARRIGLPCVLKTRRLGYDGKGQCVICAVGAEGIEATVVAAWESLGSAPCILEAFVPHTAEVSMIAVRAKPRGCEAQTAFYPLTENVHRRGILWSSVAPAPCDPDGKLDSVARGFVQRLVDSLDHVGTIAVEFFVTEQGLIANELAPRVHNSGHWTIDGAHTSQFENHLRAIASWPLGSPTLCVGACAMINLVGLSIEPSELLARDGARVHLYGKDPRPGRKLGHVTLCADTPAELAPRLARLESLVEWA